MAARTATLTNSTTIIWSDSTPFNGYLFMVLGYPTSGSVAWPSVAIGGRFPNETIPKNTPFPIKDGNIPIENAPKLFLNADIVPPGSRYFPYFYDSNLKLVSNASVNGVPITLENSVLETVLGSSPVTITIPTAAASPQSIAPATSFAEEHS